MLPTVKLDVSGVMLIVVKTGVGGAAVTVTVTV